MKSRISTIILILVFIIGLSLLLYPTVSDYWNSFHQSRAIISYAESVAEIDGEEYERLWNEAVIFNEKLAKRGGGYTLTDIERAEYEKCLNISGDGIIGYIEIKRIKCSLPIYHGTDDVALQVAVGHLEGTSLPIGGEGTHCALSGHRGLPSAKLFTDLDRMTRGDTFVIRVLDETITYEVDQVLIVDPSDMSALAIEDGKDYCTLITCTPYGINTHRLLVRGHRTKNAFDAASVRVTADALQIAPIIVAPVVAAPIILLLLIWLIISTGKKRSR